MFINQFSMETDQNPSSPRFRGIQALAAVAGTLFVLRLAVAFIMVPEAVAPWASLFLTVLFIIAPIVGLFFAANEKWSPVRATSLVVIGVLFHLGLTVLIRQLKLEGVAAVVLTALAQTGLLLWCAGLGALVSSLLKDKNILLPIALVLAAIDIFVVTSPIGTVKQVLQKQPEILEKVAYSVPKAAIEGQQQGVQVNIGAYVGPADLFFLMMFFVAIWKFGLRAKETLRWMSVALVGYLLIVLFFGDVRFGEVSLAALPALVPIGAVILLVNRKEFTLSRDEIQSTIAVGIIGLCLASYGLYSGVTATKAKPVEPSQKAASAKPQAPQATP